MRPDRFDNESGSRPVRAIRRLLWFLGATAVFGGIAMVFRIGPDDFLPIEWLDPVPLVNSWTVPGLVLFLFFGVGSLSVVWLSRPGRPGPPRRGHLHWSWVAPIVIGGCLTIWILVQFIYLPSLSPLQVIYGAVGIALICLPLLPSVNRVKGIEPL